VGWPGIVCLAFLASTLAAEPAPAGPSADALELAVWEGGRPLRWQFRVEVDGRPVGMLWDEAFTALFAFADRDGNGTLDRAEAERLPSAFGLRQILWGGFVTGPGAGPLWSDLDRDGDGQVTRAELVDYYVRGGLGGVFVGAGRPPLTAALTDALLRHLDADGDGTVSEKEWRAAADTLARLDQNDDELISPGELVSGASYPGAAGAALLGPTKRPGLAEEFPLLVLPRNPADTSGPTAWLHRLGGTVDFAPWRGRPADARWVVRLGTVPPEAAPLEEEGPAARRGDRLDAASGQLRVALRVDRGRLAAQWAEGRKRLLALFAEADTDGKGVVTSAQAGKQHLAELRALLFAADRNGDGRLDAEELAAWLAVRAKVVRALPLVTVLDHGPGLFELLDTNHDGALSVRELRNAWQRLQEAGCVRDGRFERERLPRQLRLTVSAGLPESALGRPPPVGPAWFRAMDRNGDGDVSRREFTGPADLFDKLDTDKDGLLSPEEAAKLGK
jgi:Ca2+-binding EF-hand superfamily protein